jgi:Domain of unknown function (DUF5667)
MSLFRGTLRPPAILSDEAVERYLATREELAPDPLFRRRLRGEVMNRYVAAREGMAGAVPRRRSMGKLGRAVLYASFTLALSTTSVLAASQISLPGDVLYPLKRHVESLRMEVLPAHLHHDLAAYELAERIDELARLTEKGDVARASALTAEVAADYEAFIEEADASGVVTEDRYLPVLTALLDRLPEPAQAAVEAVIARAPSHGNDTSSGATGGTPPNHGAAGSGNGSGHNSSSGAGAGVPGVPNDNSNGNGPGGPSAVEPTPKSSRSPKPQPMPRASIGANPASTEVPGTDRGGGNASGADNEPDQHDQ